MPPLSTDDIKNYIAEDEGMSIPTLPQVDDGTTLDDDTHTSTRIRFASLNQVHFTINLDDYSKKERNKCWYTRDMITKSRAKHHKTVQRMEAGLKEREASPYRGLKTWTKQGHEEISERITTCVDVVMDEQDFQWECEEDDGDRMAQCSMAISTEGIANALQQAQKDAREAQKAYQAMEGEQEQDTGSVGTCTLSPRSVTRALNIFEIRGGPGSPFSYKNQMKKRTQRSKRYQQKKKVRMVPGWGEFHHILDQAWISTSIKNLSPRKSKTKISSCKVSPLTLSPQMSKTKISSCKVSPLVEKGKRVIASSIDATGMISHYQEQCDPSIEAY
jgi:hypothetical protein